ncbi:hypothetical protein BJY52DRAFT_536114 [Lactarius psammicola]|nr:hypothetical protein BJY52DRAFT_536114 [Lactarius psammicola]
MVNRHDPDLLLPDFLVLIKLLHALAGLYIWETVFTAGFELNVLRGKQPYKWTIWLYLGTRYTCLLMFIVFFIHDDGGHVPCRSFEIANYALAYASWGFASLIIVLRVIAIWDRNIIVSSIALSMWSGALGVSIRTLTTIEATYNSVFGACATLKTHSLVSAAATILAVDIMLLVTMLVGLLRHAHRRPAGIWHLLYKQCIIWMVLAAIAEIPPVVFLILNLNDAWNEMFLGVGITIMSICAARMYRSLSKHGSLTEYSPDPPQFPARLPVPNYRDQGREAHVVYSPTHFTTAGTAMQSDRNLAEQFVLIPAERIEPESVPGASNSRSAVLANTKSKDIPDDEMSLLHAV